MTSQFSDQSLIAAVKHRLPIEAKLWGHDGELTGHAQNKLNGAAALAFISHKHKAGKALIDLRFVECWSCKAVSEALEIPERTIRWRIARAFEDMCENIPAELAEALLKVDLEPENGTCYMDGGRHSKGRSGGFDGAWDNAVKITEG